MVSLDYNLEPLEVSKLEGVNLTTATATDLDYYLFCGSVFFQIDGIRFDADWGWIPILDFATQLFLIVSEINDGEVRTLEFTESEATIEFQRAGSDIEVSAEYASAMAKVSHHELQQGATAFFRRVLDDLLSRWPQLAANPFFKERRDLLNPNNRHNS
jgi:hypothetical protein